MDWQHLHLQDCEKVNRAEDPSGQVTKATVGPAPVVVYSERCS